MVDETPKQETVGDVNKETPQPNKKVIGAGGNEIELKKTDMAILVVLDTTTGFSSVYNIQNAARSAYARMLLNEAKDLYSVNANAYAVAEVVIDSLNKAMEANKNKGGLKLPFGK